MWLNQLKIAIVEKNIERLSKLMDDIPQLETLEERTEALYLIKEASALVSSLQNDASVAMKQIQKNLNFLKSTQEPNINRFDIKS